MVTDRKALLAAALEAAASGHDLAYLQEILADPPRVAGLGADADAATEAARQRVAARMMAHATEAACRAARGG